VGQVYFHYFCWYLFLASYSVNMQKLLLLILLSWLIPRLAYPQGCSDAGFCTMGAMKPDQHLKTRRVAQLMSMEISQYVGRTKFEDYIFATTIEANVGIGGGNKNMVQVKVPYMLTMNKLENTQGLGDISLSYTRTLLQQEKLQLSATLGGKIPTNRANKKTSEGLPLPMYHQTSLGTYDLVAGVSLLSKGWLIATGLQVPLINMNQNEFTWAVWRKALPADDARRKHQDGIPMSRDLIRGADVMLRIERNFRFQRMDWHVGVLGIYRLKEDVFTNGAGVQGVAPNTKGLVISSIVGFTYHLSAKSGLKVVYGDALQQRKFNPDGLSREQVYTLGYMYNF
jgi:hypothetical protein